MKQQINKKQTPKKPRQSIRHDVVSAADYNKYIMPWACEDCTHYNSTTQLCTLGYSTKWHNREYQRHTFELSGKMALCRFQEID
ncbi:MAG: hypothetical protein FMNOHCHN_03614 [Ignavibacteriaceae bacterium]|nr:hypothetical protein [Ignavibacteriaceae bacterium]GIL17932.1 MAG: hypothetical protein BroJett040_16830 [Oligoflexia bacterium]